MTLLEYFIENERLRAEWAAELNTEQPSALNHSSHEKVWWRCKEGHEWQAAVYSRVYLESNCPVCANMAVKPGVNDLASTAPEIAAQWHPTLNGELSPEKVVRGSAKRVWWRCDKGHEWQATVVSRANSGNGCPCCAGLRVIPGETDIVTLHPDIAGQWDYELNGDVDPRNVSAASHAKVWWRCKEGHSWQAAVFSRTLQKSGCPYCSNKAVLPGYNDLATLHPDIAAQWHPELNGDLSPVGMSLGSKEKVWWRCEKGHEWQAKVASRIRDKSGCPYCSGRNTAPGENDLATLRPDLAKEWHPTLNGDLKPENVSLGSRRQVWWRCEKGHEWEALVHSRTAIGTGCPYCAGKRPIPGVNDLATLRPDLAREWHESLNIDLKPEDVKPGSGKTVWWRCKAGHEWQAKISVRARQKASACPVCSGKAKSSENLKPKIPARPKELPRPQSSP